MRRWLAAVALVAACRGDRAPPPDRRAAPAPTGVVPYLPQSPDGAEELRAIDRRIAIHAREPQIEIALLLERATYLGRADDYADALARSAALVAASPDDREAWATRTRVLAAVHEFAAAREALAHVQALATDRGQWLDLQTSLDEAAGPRDRALAARADGARTTPNATSLTLYAADLALAGRYDDALALVPKAAAAVHDNSPQLFGWLLFQWGRVYEQKGDLAAARRFYEAACARLPGYLEATVHLAQAMLATGDRAGAERLVDAALGPELGTDAGGERVRAHPALLELGAQLGRVSRDEARAAWDAYVQALPKAFADHAARFYLGAGAAPDRALALARANLANRDVPEARALVVEAALAAADPQAACAVVDPLIAAPARSRSGGASGASEDRRTMFAAWRALSACGRAGDADRLAKDLGITP